MTLNVEQVGQAIRLSWEFIPPQLSFNLSPNYDGNQRNFDTNQVTIPYACTLYMDNTPTNANLTLSWVKNGSATQAYGSNSWSNRTMSFNGGDTLLIRAAYSTRNDYNNATLTLKFTNANGYVVSTFNYSLKGTGSVCLLTSAMVDYYGLEDQGPELTAMRRLREEYINVEGYLEIINEYYDISGEIIEKIDLSEDKEEWYEFIYDNVKEVQFYIEQDDFKSAHDVYMNLYEVLKNEFYNAEEGVIVSLL